MPTLWLYDFKGEVTSVDAEESANWYDVKTGEHKGRYFKIRNGIDFFLAKEPAEQAAVVILERKIARLDFDIENLQQERDVLQERLDELGGGNVDEEQED